MLIDNLIDCFSTGCTLRKKCELLRLQICKQKSVGKLKMLKQKIKKCLKTINMCYHVTKVLCQGNYLQSHTR